MCITFWWNLKVCWHNKKAICSWFVCIFLFHWKYEHCNNFFLSWQDLTLKQSATTYYVYHKKHKFKFFNAVIIMHYIFSAWKAWLRGENSVFSLFVGNQFSWFLCVWRTTKCDFQWIGNSQFTCNISPKNWHFFFKLLKFEYFHSNYYSVFCFVFQLTLQKGSVSRCHHFMSVVIRKFFQTFSTWNFCIYCN